MLRGPRRPGGPARRRRRWRPPRAGTHLEEELGDLLFQIVFHARLAHESGQFDLADVARAVHDKLVHRHPHVFGDVDAESADQVASNWEEIKKSEKGRTSVTDGIPARLPALMLATKLARKARAVGVDPHEAGRGRERCRAHDAGARAEATDPHPDDPLSADDGAVVGRAVGELLFAVATLAQRVGVDAEQALRDRALVAARGDPRGRRRPRTGDGQPLSSDPGVRPGKAPKE